MGRSKSTATPTMKKTAQLDSTPNQSIQKGSPVKSTTKRPLPEDFDSEEEIHELLPQNGILKSKKGKFTLPENDVSDEDVSASETDDSEEEDESESNPEALDEDDDDDEDDEEDDESDVEPLTNSKVTKQVPSAQPKVPTVERGNKDVDTPKKLTPAKPVAHLVIPNPPKDLQKLKKVIVERGYAVEGLNLTQLRVAHLTVPSTTSIKNLVSGEKAFSLDGNTVHFIHLDGSPDALNSLESEANDTLFLSGIPKSVTLEMITTKLPKDCKPVSTKLLSSGPRNKQFNAALFTFSSKSDATTALCALKQVKFAERTIFVNYARPRQDSEHQSSDATTEFDIRVMNAPKGNDEEILSRFPGANNGTWTNDYFSISFPDATTRRKAAVGEKVIQGTILHVTLPGGLDNNVRLFKNIPFDASEAELRKEYPKATKITMNKRHDGAFNGSAMIEFPSAVEAQAAVSKNVSMKGRRIFAHCTYVDVDRTKVTPKKPTPASKPSKEVPPQVGSASDEDDEEESSEESDVLMAKSKMSSKHTPKNDDDDEDDDEDEDDEDDNDDDDEDDDDDESEGSEDEGIEEESDEEMPMSKSQEKFAPKKQFGKFDKQDSGNRGGGSGRGFTPRGRGFGGDRGRGGHQRGRGGPFKPRGGGRGRGNFQRGRGSNRGSRG